MRTALALLAAALLCPLSGLSGCEKKSDPTAKSAPHEHGPGGEHKEAKGGAAQPVKVVQLGVTTIGPFSVKATRDEGAITPGGEAPIDVWLTPTTGVTSVRFWIGMPNAAGSVKAKADIEDPKEPNRWHTHAEIPDPMPPTTQLWVEIEIGTGEKVTGSFDLKA